MARLSLLSLAAMVTILMLVSQVDARPARRRVQEPTEWYDLSIWDMAPDEQRVILLLYVLCLIVYFIMLYFICVALGKCYTIRIVDEHERVQQRASQRPWLRQHCCRMLLL